MRYLFFILISSAYLWANAHIFIYHRFDDPKRASTNTSLKELRKEFDYFANNGYKVVPLSDIVKKIKNKQKVPDNWVALTIDDSYKSFYYKALPLFKEYEYPFSLYVYTEASNRSFGDFMSWRQIKEASKYGEIGLHSFSHKKLPSLSDEEVKEDTKRSMEDFIKNLGFKPKGYAYPYGEYDERVKNIVKSFGFDYILNQTTGSVNDKSDLHDLNRIALVGNVNLKQKLKYKTLPATFIEPKSYPKDGILKKVKAKVDKNIKTIKVYVTGHGWIENVKVKNGIVDLNVNLKLKRSRTRVMLGTDYYTVATQMIIK